MCAKITSICIVIVILSGTSASPGSYYTSFKQYAPEIIEPPSYDFGESHKPSIYDIGGSHKPTTYDFSDVIIPAEPWETIFSDKPHKTPDHHHYIHEEILTEPPKIYYSHPPPSATIETIPSYQEIFIKYPKPGQTKSLSHSVSNPLTSKTNKKKQPQKNFVVNKNRQQVLRQGFQNRPSKQNMPHGFVTSKPSPAKTQKQPSYGSSKHSGSSGKSKNRYEVYEAVDDVPPEMKKGPAPVSNVIGTNPMKKEKKQTEEVTGEPKIKLKLWYDVTDEKE